jgi:glycosyltransferase involved in cell wall biosynthesis
MSRYRVLWLLNHTTLRKFEIEQLRNAGVDEIFLPKSFPYDEGNLSANVDYSLDAKLSIPQHELDILNAQDWYSSPSLEAWEIANSYFDVAIIGFFPKQMKSTIRRFKGAVVLRVFGLSKGYSYSELIYKVADERLVRDIKALGRRFWFGAGYEHLHQVESRYLANRNCFLPVGLSTVDTSSEWTGKEPRVLFVCPRIASSPYFEGIYQNFVTDFGDMPYTIGGAQPIKVEDPRVIGFIPRQDHDQNMREHRVMFYHSQEPNHIHYHPFEAIAAGMPLVFMAGGLLDSIGGIGLPGRCESTAEAKSKIKKILAGDASLIKSIRKTQATLLLAIKAENCAPIWQSNFRRVLDELEKNRREQEICPHRQTKIAVVIPVAYKGGTLRGAKLLAQAIYHGSAQAGEPSEVILLHLDCDSYSDNDFSDLCHEVKRRTFNWKQLDANEARRAMRYAGHDGWEPRSDSYSTMDDGIKQLQDCDLWLIVSDRLSKPLLPLRPVIHMVYDYLQRYVPILPNGADQSFLNAARTAERTFVTTEFTRKDAIQYAGVPTERIRKLPMLAPIFSKEKKPEKVSSPDYFIWTTNISVHKNHSNALLALQYYYEDFEGTLNCEVTGVDTSKLLSASPPHLQDTVSWVKGKRLLSKRISWRGDLPERDYQRLLSGAAFLWHAGRIDNGTFSVIEAACLGIPALSSDYPPMREIDQQFTLNLAWMDANDPKDMARALKAMEQTHRARRTLLPSTEQLAQQSVKNLAGEYWKAIRECL